jgi:ADP-ribosyl-[dinitrogen reductase] hydrolase
VLARAQGCLLGYLAGDTLGSLVEFRAPQDIRREYPTGVRELADGGTWNTIAGQPDDSEMALLLARMLSDQGRYDPADARKAYVSWLDSGPSDCGMTVSSAVSGCDPIQAQVPGRIRPYRKNYECGMMNDE